MMLNTNTKNLIKAINNKVIETEQYIHAKTSIEFLQNFEGVRSIGMMLLGETGLGKSTVLNKFESNNTERLATSSKCLVDYDFTALPILKFDMPEQPTLKNMCKAILEAASHPNITGTGSTLTNRVDNLIKHRQVQYLIIDECQHLLKEHGGNRTTEALNFIKNRMNEHKIIVIVAGIPTAEDAINKYPELAERLSYKKCYIRKFDIRTKESMANFGSFLLSFQTIFTEHNTDICQLYETTMVHKLYLACAGSPRLFKYLLTNVIEAHAESKGTITENTFHKAYQQSQLNRYMGVFNPFSASIEKVKVRIGEWLTFEQNNDDKNKKINKTKRKS